MKKSYDYFKTFKILSDEIFTIYRKLLKSEDYSSHKLTFFAEKSEFFNNLHNEFITPFDRGDIFLLADCLSNELESVLSLRDYAGLVSLNEYNEEFRLYDSLNQQSLILAQLKNFRGNLRLFEQCSQAVKSLNNSKNKIEKSIVNAVCCNSEQPLINYIVYSKIFELNRCIHKTLVETERILIINS